MTRSFTRRRLLAALPVATVSAGCSTLVGPSVEGGVHEVLLHYRVNADDHTMRVVVESDDQTILLEHTFSLPPGKRVAVATFEGKPARIEITLDDRNTVSHEWSSPDCGANEKSSIIINYATAINNGEIKIEGNCVPTKYLKQIRT